MVKVYTNLAKELSTYKIKNEIKNTILTDRINIPITPRLNAHSTFKKKKYSNKLPSLPYSHCSVKLVDIGKKSCHLLDPHLSINNMGMITELTDAISDNSGKEKYLNGLTQGLIKEIKISQNTEALDINISLLPNIHESNIEIKILENACSVRIKKSTYKYTYPHHILRDKSFYKYDALNNLLTICLAKKDPLVWALTNEVKHDSPVLNGHAPKPIPMQGGSAHMLNHKPLPLPANLNISNEHKSQVPSLGSKQINIKPHLNTTPLIRGGGHAFQPIHTDISNNIIQSSKCLQMHTPSNLPIANTWHPFITPENKDDTITTDILKPLILRLPRLRVQWCERDEKTEVILSVKNCMSCQCKTTSLPTDPLTFTHNSQRLSVTFEKFQSIEDVTNLFKTYAQKDEDPEISQILENLDQIPKSQSVYVSFDVILPAQVKEDTLTVSIHKGNIKVKFEKEVPNVNWNLRTVVHILDNGKVVNEPTQSGPYAKAKKSQSPPTAITPTFDINTKCRAANGTPKACDTTSPPPQQCSVLGPHNEPIALPGPSPRQPSPPPDSGNTARGYTGLLNLGNTCFMNCVIQILANTLALRDYFLEGTFKAELNVENPLGLKGELATAFAELMQDLWCRGQSAIAPSKLKHLIAMKATQFSGYSQHDAQEFLAFLLDGLHEDLNRIKDKPYTLQVETDGKTDEEISDETWCTYMKRNDSFISDLFLGQYKSLLTCPECKTKSTTFDPLLYMTLPLPEKSSPVSVYFFDSDPLSVPIKFEFHVSLRTKARDIIQRLSAHDQCDRECIGMIEVEQSRYCRTLQDDDEISCIPHSHDILAFRQAAIPTASKQILILQTLDERGVDERHEANSMEQDHSSDQSFNKSLLGPSDDCDAMEDGSEEEAEIRRDSSGPLPPPADLRMGTCFGGNSGHMMNACELSPSPQLYHVPTPPQPAPQRAQEGGEGSGSRSNFSQNPIHHMTGGKKSRAQQPGTGAKESAVGRPFLLTLPIKMGYVALCETLSKFASHTVVMGVEDKARHITDPASQCPHPPLAPPLPPSAPTPVGGLMGGVTPNLTPRHYRPDPSGEWATASFSHAKMTMETNLFDRAQIIYASSADAIDAPRTTLPPRLAQPSFKLWTHEGSSTSLFSPACGDEVDLSNVSCLSIDWQQQAPASESDASFAQDSPSPNKHLCATVTEKNLVYENHSPCKLCEGTESADEHTLQNCLKLFAKKEILNPEEAWYCPTCKTHRQAEKTMCLWRFPKILIIIFKRFSYGTHFWREKLDKLITFPLKGLDLRDVYEGPNPRKPIYDLYGVINHHGTLLGGHYTSYARTLMGKDNTQELNWRTFDDSSVSDIQDPPEPQVISPASYVLFYKLRRE